jgi:hypothetical protein
MNFSPRPSRLIDGSSEPSGPNQEPRERQTAVDARDRRPLHRDTSDALLVLQADVKNEVDLALRGTVRPGMVADDEGDVVRRRLRRVHAADQVQVHPVDEGGRDFDVAAVVGLELVLPLPVVEGDRVLQVAQRIAARGRADRGVVATGAELGVVALVSQELARARQALGRARQRHDHLAANAALGAVGYHLRDHRTSIRDLVAQLDRRARDIPQRIRRRRNVEQRAVAFATDHQPESPLREDCRVDRVVAETIHPHGR